MPSSAQARRQLEAVKGRSSTGGLAAGTQEYMQHHTQGQRPVPGPLFRSKLFQRPDDSSPQVAKSHRSETEASPSNLPQRTREAVQTNSAPGVIASIASPDHFGALGDVYGKEVTPGESTTTSRSMHTAVSREQTSPSDDNINKPSVDAVNHPTAPMTPGVGNATSPPLVKAVRASAAQGLAVANVERPLAESNWRSTAPLAHSGSAVSNPALRSLVQPLSATPVDTLSDGLFGIRNLGNTCFAASVTQMLRHSPSFIDALRQRRASRRPKVQEALRSIDESLKTQTSTTAPLRDLMSAFFDGQQHDAHEFFTELMATLDNESGNDSWINDSVFNGKTRQTVVCSQCQHRLHKEEAFVALSVPLSEREAAVTPPVGPSPTVDSLLLSPGKKPIAALSQPLPVLIERSFRPRDIEGYSCDGCNAKDSCAAKTSVSSAPACLVIHPLRFALTSRGVYRKERSLVDIPLSLALPIELHEEDHSSSFETVEYRLVAVVEHFGRSLYAGHYAATCRDPSTGVWHVFDDSSVRRIEEDVLKQRLSNNHDVVLATYGRP